MAVFVFEAVRAIRVSYYLREGLHQVAKMGGMGISNYFGSHWNKFGEMSGSNSACGAESLLTRFRVGRCLCAGQGG